MKTIKPVFRCGWCNRKIGDPDLRAKKHYCSDRCHKLYDDIIKPTKRRKL